MIIILIVLILTMKLGKFKTKHYLFGFNILFRNLFSLVCLAPITPMRFGRRFMNTLVFKLNLVHDNCIILLRVVRIDSKILEDYLLKIRIYIDELVVVDILVRHEDHVDAILKGLPSDYAPLVSPINC